MLAIGAGSLDHAREPGFDEAPPQVRSHDHAALRAPVVAEADAFERVLAGLVDQFEVERADPVQQLVDKGGMLDHVEQEGVEAAQGPGALEEAEAQTPGGVAVWMGG